MPPLKLHRRIAGALGYELIKRRKLNDTLDQHLANLFEVLEVNFVIDVGANNGHYGRLLREAGYRGKIVSFEPLARPFEALLAASDDDDDWIAVNRALGSENAVKTINVYSSDPFSSFLDINDYGSERFKWRVELLEKQEVEIATLASLWTSLVSDEVPVRAFLKLDTQGYDIEVVQGANEVLEHIVGIQSEIATKPIYNGMPGYLAALGNFDRLGFEITGLYPVSRCKKSLAVIEYDCVMRRRSKFMH